MTKYFFTCVIILHLIYVLEFSQFTLAMSYRIGDAHHLRLRPLLKFKNAGKSTNGVSLSATATIYNRQPKNHQWLNNHVELENNPIYSNNFDKNDEKNDERTSPPKLTLGDVLSFIMLKREQMTDNEDEINDEEYEEDHEENQEINRNMSFIEPIYFGIKKKH